MVIILAGLTLAVAYLLGSIPMGVFAARLTMRINVLQFGSGRTGATNVYRAAGPLGLALTSLGDVVKGIIAIWVARILGCYAMALGAIPALGPWMQTLAGIGVVAGHNWSIFLGFRGGAGTATTIGVLAAMNVYVAIGVMVMGLTAVLVSRIASVGSITIALAMAPILAATAALGTGPWASTAFGIIGGGLTLCALTPNIRRLLAGQERRLRTN
jgi:glycerol-3-phosphate acyltransferase PlsY